MRDLRNEYDVEAPRCRGAYLESLPEDVWQDPAWFLEPKIDGERITLQIGRDRSLLVGRNRQDFMKGVARAGKFRDLSSSNPYLAALKSEELDLTVLDGELTETFRRDKKRGLVWGKATEARCREGLFVGYTVWGVLFWKGKDVRCLTERDRYTLARTAVRTLATARVRMIKRVEATKENLLKMFDDGLEGAIAKRWDAGIPAGQRTNSFWWKVKGDATRTVDAFIVGVTEATEGGSGVNGVKPRPNGKAASFTMGMLRDGKLVEVGRMVALPKTCRENGLAQFDKFKFQVVEMRVSGWDGERFRWPRWENLRTDKTPQDCLFHEQVGGKTDGR